MLLLPSVPAVQLPFLGDPPAPVTAPPSSPPPTSPHPPILILGAGPVAAGLGVTRGSGTANDPYVISGWEIDVRPTSPNLKLAEGYAFRDAISILGTTAHFLVTGNVLRGFPGFGVNAETSPNVRVEGNWIEVDHNGLAGDYLLSGARPAGVRFINGGSHAHYNTIKIEEAGHRAAVGVWLIGSGASVFGNVIQNEASMTFLEAVLLERPTSTARAEGNQLIQLAPVANVAGVRCRDGSALIRANNIPVQLAGNSAGIELVRCGASTVADNLVQGARLGILAARGASNTVRDNRIERNTFGLVLEDESGGTLAGNRLANNTYSFGIYGSADAHFRQTVDATNVADGRPIVVLRGLRDTVVDAAGWGTLGFLGILEARNVTVRNVVVTGGVQGLLLGDFDRGRAENITAHGTFRGVDLSASIDSRVSGVRGTAFAAHGTTTSRLENATLTGGGALPTGPGTPGGGTYGVGVGNGAALLTLDHVTVTGARVGLFASGLTHLTVTSSVFSGNVYGAWFNRTRGDVLRGNAIEGNAVPVAGLLAQVDARENWWGSPSGPGTVDHAQFTVVPWLTSRPAGVGDTR